MTYCSVCGEYLGFYENEEIRHPKCIRIKKIIDLYTPEKVLSVLEELLIRNENQIERKKNYVKEGKIKICPLPPLQD